MLLKEVPWSTAGVEQGHASAAILSRLHPMAGLDSVAERSFCHTALPLLQDKRHEALRSKIARLEERLGKLRTRTGAGISGRQMFFEDMVAGSWLKKLTCIEDVVVASGWLERPTCNGTVLPVVWLDRRQICSETFSVFCCSGVSNSSKPRDPK